VATLWLVGRIATPRLGLSRVTAVHSALGCDAGHRGASRAVVSVKVPRRVMDLHRSIDTSSALSRVAGSTVWMVGKRDRGTHQLGDARGLDFVKRLQYVDAFGNDKIGP
jgi:hypothetical protein